MTMNSTIDLNTLAAYRAARYHVEREPRFVLRVDEASPALTGAHRSAGVRCSAFLSACNPRGVLLDAAENAVRHRQLLESLEALGFGYWPGFGADPAGHWPGEPSVLIFGIGREAACELGLSFDQNALLWAGPEAVPRLILLR